MQFLSDFLGTFNSYFKSVGITHCRNNNLDPSRKKSICKLNEKYRSVKALTRLVIQQSRMSKSTSLRLFSICIYIVRRVLIRRYQCVQIQVTLREEKIVEEKITEEMIAELKITNFG